MNASRSAKAKAGANIALAKYWGKIDRRHNVPAVPSLSLTLKELFTETEAHVRTDRGPDIVRINGALAEASARTRVVETLDRLRRLAGTKQALVIESVNSFPTSAGLASSASGFAALVAAASHALGLGLSAREQSRLARRASASAARSVYGGFVWLSAGRQGDDTLSAKPLFPPNFWDLSLVVAVTCREAKKVGSRSGMETSRRTSPLYEAWIKNAPTLATRLRRALTARDLDAVGALMETSTFAFHGVAMASSPPLVYFAPATIAALSTVRALREKSGLSVWATMDAGPQVKALCHRADESKVARALRRTPGVQAVLMAHPGPGVFVR